MLYQHISREFFPSCIQFVLQLLGNFVSGSISLRRTKGAVSPCSTITWPRRTLVVRGVFFCGALLVGLSCFGFVFVLVFWEVDCFLVFMFPNRLFCDTGLQPCAWILDQFMNSTKRPPQRLHCSKYGQAFHWIPEENRNGMIKHQSIHHL